MHFLFRRALLAASFLGIVAAAPPPRALAQVTLPSFGPAGADSYRATAQFQLQLGVLKAQSVTLSGTILYKRSDPGDVNGNKKRDTRAQLLALDLRGSAAEIGSLQLVLSPARASVGTLEARGARGDYPASASLDVYLLLRTKYGILSVDQPIRLAGTLPGAPAATPGANATLAMAGRAGVLLSIVTPGGPLAVGQLSRLTAKTGAAIPFPPPIAGLSCFATRAILEADVVNDEGSAERESLVFTGVTTIQRGDPLDRDANGVWEIPTEIVAMQLVSETRRIGGAPLVIGIDPRSGGEFATVGRIDPRTAGTNFPASSVFDVFLQIHSPSGLVNRNEEKARLEAVGGIDRFPPSGRPFLLPLSLELPNAEGTVLAHTNALTLVFGEALPCPASMTAIGAATDTYEAAVATVDLELPGFGPAPVRLTGPMTIQRAGGATDPGTGQPRIGALITAINLTGSIETNEGETPVQFVLDASTGSAAGILFQTRPDAALPASTAFVLAPEVRVGSGANLRRYRAALPGARLAGVFQALPGIGPLCAVGATGMEEPITVDLLDAAGNRTGSITWGCLFPR